MKKLTLTKIALIPAVVAAVSACTPNISGNEIQSDNANQVTATVAGRVIAARPITVDGSDNKVGMLTGAAVGGVAGSALGGGDRMPIIGAIGGAVLGGMAGNAIQNKISTQQGMEYTVQLASGSLLTLVQGMDGTYSVGQCVLIAKGQKARITQAVADNVCSNVATAYQGRVYTTKDQIYTS